MRFALIVSGVLASSAAFAQTPAPAAPERPTKLFASSAEIQALIAKAKTDRKGDAPLTIEPLLSLMPYRTSVEYRTAVAPSAVHETEAELFVVIEGTATLVTGGKLTGEKRINPTNLSGVGIEGGSPQAIAKGDVVIVPEKTPHQITPTGGPVVVMSMHVPRNVSP